RGRRHMADAAATGALLDRAAQNAGKPAPSHLDVWKHSVEGMQARMNGYDPDRPPALPPAVAAQVRADAGDLHASSRSGVGKGMAQQAGAIKKQLGQLFHTGDKPAEGFMQHLGLAFGVLTSVEQLVSMPLAMIPTPAFPAVRIMDFDIGLPHAHNHPP